MVNDKEIGKLKLEHKVDKCIFISGKLYCLYGNFGKYINRAKGVKSTSLLYFDYMKLLDKHNIDKAIKKVSKVDSVKGHV